DLRVLAGDIGARNAVYETEGLGRAAMFVSTSLGATGLAVREQSYATKRASRMLDDESKHELVGERRVSNFSVEIPGAPSPDEIIVIGAHYDSVAAKPAVPGADDNGTGAVAVLALARAFATRHHPARTIRFVEFVNEEPPFFRRDEM